MKLSVIIPTRNRADTLTACLASLNRQTFPGHDFETIVVDNGSTDNTREVALSFAGSLQLLYFYKEEPGLHVGRHEGMRRALTDLLVFADDDIEAGPSWLETIYSAFTNPTVVLVGGNNYPLFKKTPPAWLEKLWARSAFRGRALSSLSLLDFGSGRFEIDPGYVWGCNFSIRRNVLLQAGGFHPDGMPKEKLRFRGDGETHVSNYIRATGQKTLFDARASVRHLVPGDRMNPEFFCYRAYAQGISDSYTIIRQGQGKPRLRSIAWQMTRKIKAKLLAVNGYRNHRYSDPIDRELNEVICTARQAYWDGYSFHMREVESDPELLEWVLRENYF